MATINVYLSDELKAEMAEHELNWSQIAAKAFQTAISLERTRTMTTTEAAKVRLRHSRDSATEKRQAEGVALGRKWASDTADYDQLERVAALADRDFEDAGSAAYALAQAQSDWDGIGARDSRIVMETIFGRAEPPLAEVEGFLEGAAAVFDEIDED